MEQLSNFQPLLVKFSCEKVYISSTDSINFKCIGFSWASWCPLQILAIQLHTGEFLRKLLLCVREVNADGLDFLIGVYYHKQNVIEFI